MIKLKDKIKLYGFNNLTKTLSFNIYDMCYVKSAREQEDYIKYINKQYNSVRLTDILCNVSKTIGASIINISKQDYEPQGASVNILITEEPIIGYEVDSSCNKGLFFDGLLSMNDEIMGHLDKSHITVHTYPEYHPHQAIATFRVDIDVSTCGKISPLTALDYLLDSFDSDVISIDYKVRGFTRDIDGAKLFIDHDISSIQSYIKADTLLKYDATDINVYQSNIYHTKMLIKEIDLQNYLFKQDTYELTPTERLHINTILKKEMIEIYSGMNVF